MSVEQMPTFAQRIEVHDIYGQRFGKNLTVTHVRFEHPIPKLGLLFCYFQSYICGGFPIHLQKHY